MGGWVPVVGEVERNVEYAKRLTLHVLNLGYAPMVSHLLYTQMLDDTIPEEISESIVERELGLPQNTIDFTPNSQEV